MFITQKIDFAIVSKYTKTTSKDGVKNGAHILNGNDEEKAKEPDVIAIATGSEVELALAAAESLKSDLNVRVVSAVCLELFEKQDIKYIPIKTKYFGYFIGRIINIWMVKICT